MTAPTLPRGAAPTLDLAEQTPAQHHPHRWRLHRGGIVNVWYYFDTELAFSGGRLVLRGTNGSGKSRALEMLLPFVLDADRRKMDATGAGKVRLEDLMKAGGEDQPNRVGYLWIELTRTDPDTGAPTYLTVGAFIRFSRSTAEAKAWYFTTAERVGEGLQLLGEDRSALPRDKLAEAIGAARITDSPETHRERVRSQVFGLTGESGKERFTGLLQLLHTLRSPDVGNRIEEGRLPQILSDALPPLSEAALLTAGEQLDGLSETRAAQQRLDASYGQVTTFLDTYRRYTAATLTATATKAHGAAADTRQADLDAQSRHDEHEHLLGEHARATDRLGELESAEQELNSTIAGIKASKEYADARDLDERERKVAALAQTADRSLAAAAAARRTEAEQVRAADERADETVTAAQTAAARRDEARTRLVDAGVTAALPDAIGAHPSRQAAVTEPVRASRLADPTGVPRPAAVSLTVTPTDLPATLTQVRHVKVAVEQRAKHAATRLEQSRRLDEQRGEVERADGRADDAQDAADALATEASEAATRRDDTAVALALAWRTWTGAETTRTLLPEAAWDGTGVAEVLRNTQALIGAAAPELLIELDHAAAAAADPTRTALAQRLGELRTADRTDADTVRQLVAEQAQLRAARDPEPPALPWVRSAPAGSVPLWRTVDFTDALGAEQRAGLEAALLASGLLTAVLTADGALTAADGQLLVGPAGPPVAQPLTALLTVDPASPVPAERVTAVLSRIAAGDRSSPTWVDVDGAWGNGPMTGRHTVGAARHIGAAARASARAARLAEIDDEVAALEQARVDRDHLRRQVNAQREALDAHVRTAPRSQDVVTARALAADIAVRAGKATTAWLQLRSQAERLRATWTAALNEHRALCGQFALPHTTNELTAAQRCAADAARMVETLAGAVQTLQRAVGIHAQALARAAGATGEREQAEADGESDWCVWHAQEAEFSAVKDNIGADAAKVRAELRGAETALREVQRELRTTRASESKLVGAVARAEVEARTACELAGQSRDALAAAASRLTGQLALPGVAAAATRDGAIAVALPDVTPGSVEAAVRTVLAALDRRGAAADENALIRAQQTLERELAGAFDVVATVEAGVRLVEVTDAAGRRPIAAAAGELARQRAEGAAALSDRERRVFTEFILGGVAEELRRRLRQASALIGAMNTSLSSIRTSHGIGVKLRWNMSEAAGPSSARIRQLVTSAGQVRSPRPPPS